MGSENEPQMAQDDRWNEAVVLNHLREAWNIFVRMKHTHPDDVPDFRRAIHDCQRIIGMRELRRTDPGCWEIHTLEGQ